MKTVRQTFIEEFSSLYTRILMEVYLSVEFVSRKDIFKEAKHAWLETKYTPFGYLLKTLSPRNPVNMLQEEQKERETRWDSFIEKIENKSILRHFEGKSK